MLLFNLKIHDLKTFKTTLQSNTLILMVVYINLKKLNGPLIRLPRKNNSQHSYYFTGYRMIFIRKDYAEL